MRRVVIIGGIGAGKSMFARELSRITGLELYSLDKLFIERGGGDRETWRNLQSEIIARDSWIVEGNYGATVDMRLKRADCVVFMDFPTLTAFWGFLRRIAASKLRSAQSREVVEGCNARFDPKLIRYAWTFNRKHRTGIVKGLARYPQLRVVTLRSRREAEAFLRALKESGRER